MMIGKGFIKVYMNGIALMKTSKKDGIYILNGHTCFGIAGVAIYKTSYNSQRLHLDLCDLILAKEKNGGLSNNVQGQNLKCYKVN